MADLAIAPFQARSTVRDGTDGASEPADALAWMGWLMGLEPTTTGITTPTKEPESSENQRFIGSFHLRPVSKRRRR